MIWELSQDSGSPQTSLLTAIHQVVGDPCGGNGNNSAPTASVTSPSNGSNFTIGDNIVINATASDSDGNVTKVEFYAGAVKLGEDSSQPYSYTWTNAALGSYSITAKAIDNDNRTGTSSAINITVNPSGGGSCDASQTWRMEAIRKVAEYRTMVTCMNADLFPIVDGVMALPGLMDPEKVRTGKMRGR